MRLSDSLSRALIVAAALCAAVTISFFAIRMAVAANGAERESAQGFDRATRLEPGNPEYWYQRGHFQQFNLEQPDSAEAEQSFKRAIAIDPNDADAWLDLGTAYELDGNPDRARQAYDAARRSYPASAEVSWRYGNFLLRQGDARDAYPEFRHSLENDPHRAAAAFSRCYRANPDIDEILSKVLPPVPGVYVDVIAEAAAAKQLAVAEIVWRRLLTLHPKLAIGDFQPLVSALMAERDPAAARRVWEEGTAAMYLPALLPAPGSLLWDPSFESNLLNAEFSWRFLPLNQGVASALDVTEKHSGTQSLRITFDGKHNPTVDIACTTALVLPAARYRLSGWIKTRDITTEQGIEFRVHSFTHANTESPLVTGARSVTGTSDWTLLELPYTTGSDVRNLYVCISREHSYQTDAHIFGSAWIDDVNLVPEPDGPVKP